MKTVNVVLITPPFTQLNTPYPATMYLKGFLNTQGISSYQSDLGIEVILQLFSRKGLEKVFSESSIRSERFNDNCRRIFRLKEHYLDTIDAVISFLQNKTPELAHLICTGNFLPEAGRFEQLSDLDWAFGNIGIQDKAKHLATLYLEDISDFMVDTIDPHFGFTRYAERLSRYAHTFDELYNTLNLAPGYIDEIALDCLQNIIRDKLPKLLALSAPFPGNVYSAFRCAQWVKQHYPGIFISLGGGFANTELRSLSDPRVFEFFDFICLDDGEACLLNLLQYINGQIPQSLLKRTFVCNEGKVSYINGSLTPDFRQKNIGTPDYSDLPLDSYLSVLELANPMHRLWSDGRWNKMTLAHGCYWGKCTFCDISLDYIKNYEATTAEVLADRMEELIQQTDNNSFHFVDEAAPPALMRELALEIIKRKLSVVWWTNIRFEKSFTEDLCILLAQSGCIAVSGGLEVASDRLLQLIDKGVSVEQVARVADNLTSAGIMVHAYLMYGFPTQTAQETIDALEVVRQLFEENVVQSGFWHQFAMTVHSPVGMHPEKFNVSITQNTPGSFANNDLEFTDPGGCQHEKFSAGLKKSLFNYMHGLCFDFPLQEWFDFKIPFTRIPRNYIRKIIHTKETHPLADHHKIAWIGNEIELQKKGRLAELIFFNKRSSQGIHLPEKEGVWLSAYLNNMREQKNIKSTIGSLHQSFREAGLENFEKLWNSTEIQSLKEFGLLYL